MMIRYVRYSVLMIMLAGIVAAAVATPAVAQEDDPLAGTTVESLGGIAPPDAEGRTLVLLRITMEEGAAIPAHHHPGTVVVSVDSGVFETEIMEGSGTITRAAVDGTPGATEPAEAGGVLTLNQGDTLAYEQDVVHTMVNGGDGPLVLLVSALLDPSQPGFIFMATMEHEATPAARHLSGYPLSF